MGKDAWRGSRIRTCKRCGAEFDSSKRESQECCWHSGRFVLMDGQGQVIEGASARDVERRAQKIIRAENKKKTSKKSKMVVFGQPGDCGGVDREDGLAWQWS